MFDSIVKILIIDVQPNQVKRCHISRCITDVKMFSGQFVFIRSSYSNFFDKFQYVLTMDIISFENEVLVLSIL